MFAKCDVSIELENGGRRYDLGDPIRGVVHVYTRGKVKCDNLSVSMGWSTHGRGNRDSGAGGVAYLFSGEWDADGDHAFPFELRTQAPLTYRGKLLNLDWYLEARADVPWAIDAKARTDFIVKAGPEATVQFIKQRETDASIAGPVIGALVAGIFGVVFMGFIVGAVASGEPLAMMITLGFVAVLLLFVGQPLARTLLGGMRVKDVETTFEIGEPSTPGAARTLDVTVRYASTSRVNGIHAELKGSEVVVSGSGTNRTTHTHQFHGSRQVNPGAKAGQHETFFSLPLPDNLAQLGSIDLSDNDVTWSLRLHFDVPNWPDFVHTETLQLVVRP